MTRALALASLFIIFALGPGLAQDSPEELMTAARKAHENGTRCIEAARKTGANQFVELEKAIGHLEQGARLMERYMELRPDDTQAEALLQDICSLLFWAHKMSPVSDPEAERETAPTPPPPTTEAPPPTTPEDGEPPPPTTTEAPPPTTPAAPAEGEEEAARLLAEAREYQQAHPQDGMGALAKLFYVAERFPGTAAGREAKAAADELQRTLFAAAPLVQPRPVVEPITADDRRAIERALRDWLDQRRRLRCTSCKGEGSSECRTCDGSGEVRLSAGRRSTCNRCRRGRVPCERRGCVEGIDVRTLEKVVIDARAPYYQEKIRALLGGHRDALTKFLEALAATLAESPRAPAEVSRCATELGIAPVALRDIIDAHGPTRAIVRPYNQFTLGTIDRTSRYTLRGDENVDETVSFEKQDGAWYLRRIGQDD